MKICPTCRACYEDADAACREAGHAPLAPSRPGSRLIDGRYRLDKLLGRGGMGAVYAGVHVELERPAAIKLLLPDLSSDPKALERFRGEARAAARLNHPNVAGTYDFGTLPGGESYIVMELVEGETLREHLAAAGALPPSEAVRIARQIADGIESAHRGGVVHRDLKPSNVVVSRDHHGEPFVKVLDFGVAKLKEHTTGRLDSDRAGRFVGTPHYMSPEQCADHKVDARSDIYSLGVILYEMIAGRPPFDAPNATALALKHIREPPPPLEEARAGVPDTLARLVAWALAKDPAERPQTAAEFSRALQAAQEQGGLSSSVLAPAAPPRPEVGRRGEHYAAPSAGPGADVDAPASDPGADLHEDPPRARWRRRLLLVSAMAAVFVVSALGAFFFLKWRGRSAPARNGTDAPSAAAPSPAASPSAQAGADTRPVTPVTDAPPAPSPTPEKKEPAQQQPSETDRRALQTALGAWVSATNSRDVKSQLAFYAPRLEVFYRSRNVTRDAVLKEKRNAFGRATRVSITVADPRIEVGRDGLTAVMKFRKRYVIETGGKREAGEVLQELQWARTKSDRSEWKITGERDLQVIR